MRDIYYPGSTTAECATGNENAFHARCKSTICACDCHHYPARLDVLVRLTNEGELSRDNFIAELSRIGR
jgi:hypothetical protein